jgi:site-specific DNA-methyltransferase (adenine-specific)
MAIELLHIDCMEYMKTVPDKFFDLAIVDPPYGIGVNHNMGRRRGDKPSNYKPAEWDSASPSQEYFNELFRTSKDQIVWGANHFISKMPKDSSCWLMWDKMFSEDLSFAQFEMAWTSFDEVCKKFTKDPKSDDRIHPTQKPVKLYKWLLKNYAKEGDKIFDSHLGSGSIAIACHDMKFDLVGCEIDKDYYDAAVKRFENHKKQLSMF